MTADGEERSSAPGASRGLWEEKTMAWRWRLAELFGIVIYMHVTFLLLLGWVALSHFLRGHGIGEALSGILLILLLFACVVMHEFGHALTARRYGIRTRDITLLPIGGVARLERMPRDPAQELTVALAGPAVNVAIAAFLYLLLPLFRGAAALADVHVVGGDMITKLMWFNVSIVIFNLIPAFPMDGGRVLRALLAQRMDYVRATRIAANVGQMIAFGFGFLGLVVPGQFLLLFIALFVYMGAEAEAQSVQVQWAFRGLPVRRAMVTRFASLAPTDSLSQAVQLLLSSSQQDFPVAEDGEPVGLLTRRDLLQALHDHGPGATVQQGMRLDVASVEANAPLEETFQRLQTEELPAAPVTDMGRLVGLITMENIAEFLMIRAALEGAPTTPGQGVSREGAAAEQRGEGARPVAGRRRGEQF
jgi:Zn-dependent protease/CBS domain-containing protein